MNYEKILNRGNKYTDATIKIWSDRSDNLISFWCRNVNKRPRVDKIIVALQNRIKLLLDAHFERKTQAEKVKFEAGMQFIHLQCPSFECRYSPCGYGVSVRLKDYTPGEIKCEKCGSVLSTKEDWEITDMLHNLNML